MMLTALGRYDKTQQKDAFHSAQALLAHVGVLSGILRDKHMEQNTEKTCKSGLRRGLHPHNPKP